jgi:hypothetical protein
MVSKQLGFGDYEQTTAKKRTRRERFLAEMEAVVPWKLLIDLIKPHYPKTSSKEGTGRIRGHHHRLALLHTRRQGHVLCDRRVVAEGLPVPEDRLQQRPYLWPVGRLIGAAQQVIAC